MPIKPIRFLPHGPYELPREAGRVTDSTLTQLWECASEVADGIGVYIIATKVGKKLTPWYVGKTDKGFKRRFYQHSRSLKHIFAKFASDFPSEKLVVMFIARQTDGGKLKSARKPNALTKTKAVATIKRLEYDILKHAYDRNPKLLNKSSRMYLQMLAVPGLTDSATDAESESARELRKLLRSSSIGEESNVSFGR